MTNSKMIKLLSSYDDMALFEIRDLDKYDFEVDDFTKPVREVVLLSNIISEFENKEGSFYDEFHIGNQFKDLIKIIESGRSGGYRYKHYQDSYDEFTQKWNELHPDESYFEYCKNNKEKNRQKRAREWEAIMGAYGWQTYEFANRVYADIPFNNPRSNKHHR